MKRIMNVNEISEDKFLKSSDLVRVGCDGCGGSADCCRNTDDTIILDPYDMYELEAVTGLDFQGLYGKYINLRVVDGIILPYLLKNSETGACTFLGTDGRCSIHQHRPGFCRLFPLGRIYHDGGFSYFMQEGQCPCDRKPKTEVSKWLEVPGIKQYEAFILQWNTILETNQKEASALAAKASDENRSKLNAISLSLLQRYYIPPYDSSKDFYLQFASRIN